MHAESPRLVSLRGWWREFEDADLDLLVQEALTNNLDVAQAVERLLKERALVGAEKARFRPTMSAGARMLQDTSATDTFFHASVDVAWEPGLFGQADAAARASQANLYGASVREQGVRVAMVAAVVRHYLELRALARQAQLQLTSSRIEEQTAALLRIRVQTRLGGQAELEQAQIRLAQLRAAQAQTWALHEASAQALSVLLGRDRPDPAWREAAELSPRALRVAEVPADLVRTRPDIQAAEAEVLRAAAGVGAARSMLYPKLALNGSLLYAYNLTSNRKTSLDNAPALGPVIDIPLWDWGARKLRVQAEQHELQAALLAYRKAVLQGVSEVESALAGLTAACERVDALHQAHELAATQLRTQAKLQALGLASALQRLDAERELQRLEADLSASRLDRGIMFVALYKALGGAPLPASADESHAALTGGAP